MKSALRALLGNANLLVLLVSLSALCSTSIQAVVASRLAKRTIEAYAPKIEKQAVSIIVDTLPKSEMGTKAAVLAQTLATNVEGQYAALSSAVQRQSDSLTQQASSWAAVSVFALLAYLQSRRKPRSAA